MAAWLAYLKSRLLLPEKDGDPGPSAEDMATALAQRLRRLEAIRKRREALIGRPQLGRDVFGRGAPEPIADIKRPEWTATLYDLLSAYAHAAPEERARASCASRRAPCGRSPRRARRWSGMIGISHDWGRLDEFLISYWSIRRCARP
jgi:segregation and condensation protein A